MPNDRQDVDQPLKLVFNGACVAKATFDPDHRPRKAGSASGWKKPGPGWGLPLYDYPGALGDDLRELLPLCLAEWIGAPLSQEGASRHLELEPPSVTLWTPNVLLVTQDATASLEREQDIFALIDILAEQLHPLLQKVVDQALGAAAEDPALASLAPVRRELLWVAGTALPAYGVISVDPKDAAQLTGRITASPEDVGPLGILVRDLATIVTPRALPSDADVQEKLQEAIDEFVLLMALQNVVWAAAIDYDRRLLKLITKKNVDINASSLRELDDEGQELVSLVKVVASFRASLGSMEIHLARHLHSYWTYLNENWEFDRYLESLSQKVEALAQLHDEVNAAVTSRRARRLGRAAFGFNALGILTVGLAILAFIAEDVNPPTRFDIAAGVTLLLIFSVASGFVFWLGYTERGLDRLAQFLRRVRRTLSA